MYVYYSSFVQTCKNIEIINKDLQNNRNLKKSSTLSLILISLKVQVIHKSNIKLTYIFSRLSGHQSDHDQLPELDPPNSK